MNKAIEIQLIYNAQSGKLNTVFDIAHKILSPKTYACDLCQITHGIFAETAQFQTLKQNYNLSLWHIDEYEADHTPESAYPVVIIRDQQHILQRIDAQQIAQWQSITDLQTALEKLQINMS